MAKFEDQVSSESTRFAKEQELWNQWAKARDLALAGVFSEIAPSFRKHDFLINNNAGRITVFKPNYRYPDDPYFEISCQYLWGWCVGDEVSFSIDGYSGHDRAQVIASAARSLGNWIALNRRS